jgi:hypothetical protein
MNIIFMTYSTSLYKKQKNFSLFMAKYVGKFDASLGFSEHDIDSEFYDKNKNILDCKKGAGYWLWKPYFILNTLKNMNDGDILVYCDAASYFIKDVRKILSVLESYDQDVMAFELPLVEYQWTKRSLLEGVGEHIRNSNQISGSFHIVKKSNESLAFYSDYLRACCQPNKILGDNKDKGRELIEHRYDQSIFSLCYKQHDYIAFKDATQFGRYPEAYAAANNEIISIVKKYDEHYDFVIFHCRHGSPIFRLLKFKIKECLYKLHFRKFIPN